MTQNCSKCAGAASSCGCNAPIPIKACLPGAHQPATWDAWKAGCWPKGMIFNVMGGTVADPDCCPGAYWGTGSVPEITDRFMQLGDFKAINGFKITGCYPAVDWDKLCLAAETVVPDDEDFILYCKDGGLKKGTFSDFFESVCYDLPLMGSDACDIETVAYVKDAAGCGKLVRYSDAQSQLGIGRFYDVQRARGIPEPSSSQVYIWPDDLVTNPYAISELRTELGTIGAGNIPAAQADESRIGIHAVGQVEITVSCPTKLELDYRIAVASELDLKGAQICWRYKEVGTAIWRYSKSLTNELSSISSHNAVPQEVNENGAVGPTVQAGNWIVQVLVLPDVASNPVKYNFVDVPGGLGNPRITVRRRIG